ncbi:aspartate kinase [Enterococcus columbae]|uniref:Aspartokinase n=1 Tax=Enterococcus columbae DSM 7374 = ATCC 51263 TaxID=1121865 RepID=S1NEM4_9ENTE|nr:aspartate kinase [Enterococcus columbae]EOT44825.1 aspartate kinase [Enterococcus columbae DSM 7374 = ATCC 51263]EOW84118.1 aspartate kinase [Enterococcus columbae DSM 7374 = ATCC 51263]OJG23309.1 aspartate kinase [Enterococcus columbae DSM 7374 = ATCC 51263]
MKVAKFGGSSLASSGQVKKVVDIIKADPERRFVVVSAPGKRHSDDIKVTDLLISLYEQLVAEKDPHRLIDAIYHRYEEIGTAFQVDRALLEKIHQAIQGLTSLPIKDNPHLYDTILASGENNNAKLIAGILKAQGLSARYISPQELGILVTDEPQNARILNQAYPKIRKWRKNPEILVIPGFFGITEEGNICTFSRGGSDITGAIVAAGVNADLYENFTDVDGIYSAHPGIIHEPELVEELSYREMRELAYAGFSVFHDEALIPSFKAKIPVVIKNTNNPNHPGTRIVHEKQKNDKPVVGIACDRGFTMIYISKYLMNREVGFTLRVLQILKDFNINYEHMPSGIDDISIIIRSNQLTEEKEEELLRKIAYEIDPDELRIKHGLAMVVVVGEGMRERVGITAESAAALARKKINLAMINQGSSEVSIMFSIPEKDEKAAIRTLYYTFFD